MKPVILGNGRRRTLKKTVKCHKPANKMQEMPRRNNTRTPLKSPKANPSSEGTPSPTRTPCLMQRRGIEMLETELNALTRTGNGNA